MKFIQASIKNFILFILLVLIFGTLGVVIGAHTLDRDNFIERNFTNVYILQFPGLRTFFNLNREGDSRYDILFPENNRLIVEVDYQSGKGLELLTEQNLPKIFDQMFGVVIDAEVLLDDKVPNLPFFSEGQINSLRRTTLDTEKTYSYIHIIVASSQQNDRFLLGKTLDSNTIILFKDAFEILGEPAEIPVLEETVIKHLALSLVGVSENSSINCVMHPSVIRVKPLEDYENGIPTVICGDTRLEIDNIKENKF